MNNINIQDFEATITHLVNAGVKDNSKGKPMENWIMANFELESKSSRITNDGALKNRVSDPFRHEKSIVVFVCKDDLWEKKKNIILEHIETFKYPKLQAILVMSESQPFKYEKLMVFQKNNFSDWLVELDRVQAEIQEPVTKKGSKPKLHVNLEDLEDIDIKYLTAIHTKPFLILGGFSGTGKSQKVKELAYLTCPEELQDEKKPGNYALISVKPNWHDSTDLLGYESTIANKYMVTDFMRFVVKAMQYPNTPFFCCMDEMNLAPVEEYFAEYLSVLESRKKVALIDENGNNVYDENGVQKTQIVSESLVSADVFKKSFNGKKEDGANYDIFEDLGLKKVGRTVSANEAASVTQGTETTSEAFEREDIITTLQRDGLCIPENLVVIGTVNMDDTTNSFSRKVIDRAIIFETDIETFDKDKYFNAEDTLQYGNVDGATFICDEVRADKAIEAGYELSEEDRQAIIDYINELNKAMAGTSFQISYRVLNEMILYYRSMEILNNGKANLEQVKNDILMMKVLPRIEGDSAAKKALVGLKAMIEKQNIPSEWINVPYDIDAETLASKTPTPWKDSILKIAYMLNLLNTGDGFTRFWK